MTAHRHPNATTGYWVTLSHFEHTLPFFPATTIHRNEQNIIYTDFGIFPTMAAARTIASGAITAILQLNQSIGLRGYRQTQI